MTKRELQSLLGRLLYVSKVIQPARGFLNRMLQTLRQMRGFKQRIDISFKKDLHWFKKFLDRFNGCTTFKNWTGAPDFECFIDASLMGLGAVCGLQFYSVHLPADLKVRERIVVYEMVNVLVALRMWQQLWTDRKVTIFCDNHAVVDIIDGNRTRDGILGSILREILMIQARCNIQLKVVHVLGENNPIADSLSRVHMGKCNDCIEQLKSKGYVALQVGRHHFNIDRNL